MKTSEPSANNFHWDVVAFFNMFILVLIFSCWENRIIYTAEKTWFQKNKNKKLYFVIICNWINEQFD